MSYTCDFCGGNHNSRNCNYEKEFAIKCKSEIGRPFEQIISNRPCPICNNKTLYHLNDNTPSLDCFCKNCYSDFEVKSKCLSSEVLPKKIIIKHGNYIEFKKRVLLNIIIIIYGVNRKRKSIYIREILFIPYIDTIISNNIKIVKNKNDNNCKIIVNNYNELQKIYSHNKNINITPVDLYLRNTFNLY